MARILVVDDDELMRDSLAQTLSGAEYEVHTEASAVKGLSACRAGGGLDLIITDLKMPKVDGIGFLRRLREGGDDTPVVLITAYGTVETAVTAMKEGAADYIVKPFKRDTILMTVAKVLEHEKLRKENDFFRRNSGGNGKSGPLLGGSGGHRKVVSLLEKYAQSSSTVLIRGESGTGKELYSRLLHRLSSRKGKPFLSVNCAALSAGLLESELFGHEKGAFTGADRRNTGRFEIANEGTILLDEVSEIDLKLQAKLLRVLQEKEFERVGNSRSIKVDVRVVATTNRDLEEEVRQGRFRQDLYFRLSRLVVEVPPLRERKEDIPLFAEHFLQEARKRNGGPAKRIGKEAMACLMEYSWPGNVRELENQIERAYLLCEGEEITPELLGLGLHRARRLFQPDDSSLVGKTAEEVEKAHIKATLEHTEYHQKRAAEMLGMGVRTLREKMKRWSLKKVKN